MIHRIAIENFYSIAECQELNFRVADNAPDLACFKNSRSDPEIRLPSVIGFFGANASGKSTILKAIISAAIFACASFSFKETTQIAYLFQPYRQKDWWDKPTKITIEFDSQLSERDAVGLFRYELHIAHQAKDIVNNKTVAYESLFHNSKGRFRCLFERNGQDFQFGKEFDVPNNSERVNSIRPNASAISTLAQFNHKLANDLIQQILQVYINSFGFSQIKEHIQSTLTIYLQKAPCLEKLNQELRRLDIGIESMFVDQGPQGLFAKFRHVGLDNFILYDEESTGTQRFIDAFWRLFSALETGSIAVIDELDIHLHPLLLPEIFHWFNDRDRNPHNAQLLFTGHNVAILDELEKEQVFFTEKPMGQASRVYGARDIKGLRRDPSLMKKYLSGELGSVPHIG